MMSLRAIQPAASVSAPSTSAEALVLKKKACTQCRTRKVRCDKNDPCNRCVSWSLDCSYPSPIRKCHRPKRPAAVVPVLAAAAAAAAVAAASNSNATDGSDGPLDERVRRLERTISRLGAMIERQSGGGQDVEFSGFDNAEQLSEIERKLEQLLAERPLQTSKSLLQNSTNRMSINTPLLSRISKTATQMNYPSVKRFPFHSFAVESASLHPSLEQIQMLWNNFLGNVDPLVKMLHRHSVERLLHQAIENPMSLRKSEEALLFSLYFASMTSMPPEGLQACFTTQKNTILTTYRAATEHALGQANFLVTEDLTTLQAFVLFLSFSRFLDEAKLAWALTGLARRLSNFDESNITPFEREMRSRLWWQLWYLDQRAAEDHGRDAFFTDVKQRQYPLNVDDADIYPSMTDIPLSADRWTEMSFTLIRLRIADASCQLDVDRPVHEKEQIIRECTYAIHATYLHHPSEDKTLHWLAKHVSHVLIQEMWFKLYGQLPRTPNETSATCATRDRLFLAAIDTVDVSRRLETEPEAMKWRWLLNAYLQFLPLAFLLTELCHRSPSTMVDRAWKVVDKAFERWEGSINESRNGEILTQLMAKAKQRRKQMIEWEIMEQSLMSTVFMNSTSTTGPAIVANASTMMPTSMAMDDANVSILQPDYVQDIAPPGSAVYSLDAVWNGVESGLIGIDTVEDGVPISFPDSFDLQ